MWWLHGKTKPYYFPRLFRNAKIVVLFFITVGCRRCVAIALSCNGRRRHTTQTNEMKNINVLLWTVVRLSTDRRSQRQCWWKYVTTLFHRCPSQAVRCIVYWWSPNGCGFSCYSVAASADEIVASNDMFVSTNEQSKLIQSICSMPVRFVQMVHRLDWHIMVCGNLLSVTHNYEYFTHCHTAKCNIHIIEFTHLLFEHTHAHCAAAMCLCAACTHNI